PHAPGSDTREHLIGAQSATGCDSHLISRKRQAMQQVLVTGVAVQRRQPRVLLRALHADRAVVKALLQPAERLVLLSETEVDHADFVRTDIAFLRNLGQLAQDPAAPAWISGDREDASGRGEDE